MRGSSADPASLGGYHPEKHWSGRLIDSYVDAAARAYPHSVAVIEGQRRLSYEDLFTHTTQFAHRLRRSGVREGDVVSFQLPNWIEALVVHHGILKAGAISNPIIPIYREHELRHILSQAKSRVAIIPKSFRGHDYVEMYRTLVDELTQKLECWVVDPSKSDSLTTLTAPNKDKDDSLPARSSQDPALLLFTSGTTAAAKGVLHTHDSLEYENRTIIELFHLSSSDVVFMPSPVTHITGVLYGLQLPPMLSVPVVFQDIWNPTEALRLISRERCTFTVAATPFLHGLAYHPELSSHDASSLRVFGCGGADVAPELIRAAEELLGCSGVRLYGSTEYPTLTGSAPEDSLDKRSTTDGRLIGAAEARIVNEAGHEVEVGSVGEMLVRGPEMFVGYLDDTASSFRSDGWFATGDLASSDADGYLRIQGRKKDIIIRGGENISVREIEDVLFEHAKIREVAIVGVPDPVLGERACAILVPEEGVSVSPIDIVSHLEAHQFAKQKFPEFLAVTSDLPKTASGKIQKFRLKRALSQGEIDCRPVNIQQDA